MLWWRFGYRHHHRTSLRPLRSRVTARDLVVLVVATCTIACSTACETSSATSSTDIAHIDSGATNGVALTPARVVDVIDGDTIELRINKRNEMVRLIGIDTPETVHPTKPVECYGPEASAYLSALLPKGTEVRVSRDVEARDYYDRLLLYVHRASDDMFVNQHMVETGHARAYPFAPNTTFASAFATLSNNARASEIGLWGTCPR